MISITDRYQEPRYTPNIPADQGIQSRSNQVHDFDKAHNDQRPLQVTGATKCALSASVVAHDIVKTMQSQTSNGLTELSNLVSEIRWCLRENTPTLQQIRHMNLPASTLNSSFNMIAFSYQNMVWATSTGVAMINYGSDSTTSIARTITGGKFPLEAQAKIKHSNS